jgi:hypothetical protein
VSTILEPFLPVYELEDNDYSHHARQYRYRLLLYMPCGLGSSVGIETGYGLDGLGIESRWGVRFSTTVQTGPEAHPASYTMGTGSFPGVKQPGHGADHPPPSSAEVKKE